jgi:hypothetical protein
LALDETDPDRFAGGFATTLSGLYSIRVRAMGSTYHGVAFQREPFTPAATPRPRPAAASRGATCCTA